jgi:hypothetical protein
MRLLVIDRGTKIGTPEGHQAIGFQMYRDELLRKLGITVEQITCMGLVEIERAIRERPADLALVMVSWTVSRDQMLEFFRRLHELPGRPRIAFMDYYAPSGSPYFTILPYVDCYVKRQVLKDRSQYLEDMKGGTMITDFLANQLDYDLDGWNFGIKPDPGLLHKVVVGWNLGVTPRYRKLLKLTQPLAFAWKLRPISIHRRFTPVPRDRKREWYEEYRSMTFEKLKGLEGKRQMTGTGRVHHRVYLLELLASKLVVSPFGWGEVCFRDYDAVTAGALLIKPSMEHLVTHPDIYKPHETYVPVRWDLEDLTATCDYYLDHPAEAIRIIRNAQMALRNYFEEGGFVEDVRRFLEAAMGSSLVGPSSPTLEPRGDLRSGTVSSSIK